jgi:hypothetical protein
MNCASDSFIAWTCVALEIDLREVRNSEGVQCRNKLIFFFLWPCKRNKNWRAHPAQPRKTSTTKIKRPTTPLPPYPSAKISIPIPALRTPNVRFSPQRKSQDTKRWAPFPLHIGTILPRPWARCGRGVQRVAATMVVGKKAGAGRAGL